MLYSRVEDYETLPLLPSNTRVSVEGIVDGVSKIKNKKNYTEIHIINNNSFNLMKKIIILIFFSS